MKEMIFTDPIPPDNTDRGFYHLQQFLTNTQDAIDRSVRDLTVPLCELAEADFSELIDRQVKYMEFELDQMSDTIETEQALAATGKGLVLVLDEHGNLIDTELMKPGDMLVGKLGSVAIVPVATIESCVKVATGAVSEKAVDPVVSVVPILSGVKFHVLQEDMSMKTRDLSARDIGVAMAHPIQLSPYFQLD